ncbi:MAG: fibronectin type III domain-containing protein [Anaerolineales bacterium]
MKLTSIRWRQVGLFLAAIALLIGLPAWPSGARASSASATTLIDEHFDATNAPWGWSVVGTPGWRFDNLGDRTNDTGGTGNFAIADSDYEGYEDMDTQLRAPTLDLSAYAQVHLSFKSRFRLYDAEIADVDVSTDDGATWTNVWRTTTDQTGAITLDLSDQAAGKTDVVIRFRYYNANYAWYWQIDDVKITGDASAPPTPIPPTPTPAPPAAPSDLAQSGSATKTRLSLSWTDNSSNEQGFKVERSPNGTSDWTQVGTAGADVTAYTDTGLACGVTYHYRARAYNAVGDSAYSNSAEASTAACETPPAAPSALSKTGGTATDLALGWTDNSANEDGFKVQQSPNGTSDWAQVGATGANITALSVENLACGTTYHYRVYAYNTSGASGYSDVLSATTEACPPAGGGLAESFNGTTTPAGWTVQHNTGSVGWSFNDPGERGNLTGGAGNFAIADSDKAGSVAMDTELRTPALDLSTYGIVTLKFKTRFDAYGTSKADVDISGDGGATWTNVWRRTGDNLKATEVLLDISEQAAGKSDVIARFRYYDANYAWYWQIDNVRITGEVGDPPQPPAAPSDVQKASAGEASISLSWTDNSDNEDGFKLERAPHGEDSWAEIGALGANVAAYTDNDLPCGAAYDYRVYAYNVAGNSTPVTLTNAATDACINLPAAPSDLAATAAEESISLTWQDNSDNESGFKLDWLRNGVWTELSALSAGQTTYDHTGLSCNTDYGYRLYAYNDDGKSDATPIITTTTAACAAPAAPSDVKAANVTASSLKLSWRDNSTRETGFKVERSTDGATWTQLSPTANANVTSLVDRGLACNTTYHYRVRATRANVGDSAYSDVLQVRTGACSLIDEAFEGNGASDPAGSGALTLHLPLNEAAGATEFSDVSGNGLHGSCAGDACPTAGEAGLYGAAPSFDGNDYIEIPYKPALNPASFTVAAWAKVTGGSDYRAVWTSRDYLRGHMLYANPNNTWSFTVGNGADWISVGATPIANDTWTHLAGVYDAASQTLAFYVNGELAGSKTGVAFAANTQRPLRIGAGATEGAPQFHFTGLIDDVRVYERPFNGDEVRALMAPAHWTAALHLPLNEGAGATTFDDVSGYGRDGTCAGDACPTAGQTGWYGAAARFDGNDVVEIPYQAALNSNSFAVAGWAKVTGGSDYRAVWTSRDAGPERGYILYVTPGNTWEFWIGTESGWESISGGPVVNGAWTHLAGVYDAASQTMSFYVNGKLAGSKEGIAFAPNTQRPLRIGAGVTEEIPPKFYFTGLIDDVRVYDRALSADDVRALTAPGSWQVINHNSEPGRLGWAPGNEDNGEGSAFIADRIAAGGLTRWDMDTALHAPTLDLSAYTLVTMTFRMDYKSDMDRGQALVEVSTDGGASWSTLRKFVADESTTDGAPILINLSPYAGLSNVAVRFHSTSRNGGHWRIDDVRVTAASGDGTAPAAPGNLTRGGGSETDVVLNWADNSADESGFVVERSSDGVTWRVLGVTGPDIAAYTDRNLSCSESYHYRVRARNAAGFSAYTAPLEAGTDVCSTPPNAPEGLARKDATPTTITLSWLDRSGNETGFKIERSKDGAAWQEVGSVGANVTNFTDQGLFCNDAYQYRVRAYNSVGYSGYADALRTRTAACAAALKPPAPSNLTFSGQTETGLIVSWTDNSSNEVGFRIERSANNRDWTLIGSTEANVTHFTDAGLACGASYTYRVHAYSAGGGNSETTTASGQTAACPITIPPAPTNLSSSGSGETSIALAWSDNSDHEDGYKIERSPNGQTAWAQITTLGANATSYTDEKLTCDTTYYYRVRAYREGHGDSDYSNVLTTKTGACPVYPDKCNTPATGSIVLIDVAANPQEDQYRVLLEIKNPVITNKTTSGCNVEGDMHLILHSNDVSGVTIRGKVDQHNTFRSDHIGHFSVVIAGLRLYTGQPWDIGFQIPTTGIGAAPKFNGTALYMNSAWLALPPDFGGGTVPLIKAPRIGTSGLDLAQRIGLPEFPISEKEKNESTGKMEAFKLKLAVEMKFTSRGFEFSGEGALKIPGAVAGGQGCTELSAEGAIYINEATGQTLLEFQTDEVEAAPIMALTEDGREAALYEPTMAGPYLPNDVCGQPAWQGIGGKVGLAVKCSPGIPIAPYNLVVLSGVRGSVAIGMEDTSISVGATIYVIHSALLSVDGDAKIGVAPELSAEVEAKLKMLFFQMGYAKVSISESDGFRAQGSMRNPNIPLLKYEVSLHAWVSGITRDGGVVSANNPQPHLTGSGRVVFGIDKGEIIDKEVYKPCIVDTCTYHLSAPGWLAFILRGLGLPTSVDLKYPCGVNARYVQGTYTFHYKVLVPCGWFCMEWSPRTFDIPVPSGDAFENCPERITVPDQNINSFETFAEFGEFKSASRSSVWGLKGYAKILFIDYGLFVDFGANPPKVDWVNAKSYTLIDSKRALAARRLWEEARYTQRPLTAAEVELLAPYTFLEDGGLIIDTPNFDPPGYLPRAAFGRRDAITQTNVISKTDTLFGVTTRVPVVMSLISPDGVEITPDNYTTVPTYTVAYNTIYTYTLERTANDAVARWRYAPAATHPDLQSVDLSLNGTTIYTDVAVQTGYLPLPTGAYTLGIAPRGAAQPALLATFDAQAGVDYTILALGDTVSETKVFTDDNGSPAALGQAKMRLINAIYHDAEALDLYIDGERRLDDVPYADVSDYITMTAGAHTVEMMRAGSEDVLLSSVITAAEGTVYTFLTREWPSNPAQTMAMFAPQEDTASSALLDALANLAPDTSYALMWDTMLDEMYVPVTTTQYAVDQATIGVWQVKLTGAVTETGWALSVSGVENPPIISDLVVDYDNDWPEFTEVELRLQADYAPTRLSFFVKPGAISETLVITDETGAISTFDSPLYQGIEMDVITITDVSLLDGSQLITHTLDLFELETGDYSLWVQVEDGVSPAVNAYAALKPKTRAARAALGPRTVNIASESYHPFKALENTGVFHIDQTWWFEDDLVAGTAITPELNIELWAWDEAEQDWVFDEYVPLLINWTPLWHPDADYQVVAIDQWLEEEQTITETGYIKTDFTIYEVYDEYDEYLGDVSMANWYDVAPDETYYIAVGLLDVDTDTTLWSDYEELEVALGDFDLWWEEEYLEAYFWPGDGYGEVDTYLVLTMTEDLYYDLNLDFDYDGLPAGIEAEIWEGEEELARMLTARGKNPPTDDAPCPRCSQRIAKAVTEEIYEEYVNIVIYVDETVPTGWYTLPVVASAGQETSIAEVEFYVEQTSYEVTLSPGYTQTVPAGRDVVYQHTFTNTGESEDTYYLWAENYNGWEVEVVSDEGYWDDDWEDMEFTDVGADESFAFEVRLTVPYDADPEAWGETDVIIVSALDDESFDWITDYTIVEVTEEVVDVALSPGTTQVAEPGTVVGYAHTLTNTGNVTDTYYLEAVNDLGWDVELSDADWPAGTMHLWLIEIAPQAAHTFAISITVPADAADVSANTTLTATSQLDDSIFATATDVTVVVAPGAPASIDVVAADSEIELNGSTTITATLRDLGGDLYTDAAVITFTSSLGEVTPAIVNTTSGLATALFTAGDISGTATITATHGALIDTTSVLIRADPVAPPSRIFLPLVTRNYDG